MVTGIVGTGVAGAVIAGFVAPPLIARQVEKVIRAEIDERIEADVTWGDVDVSLVSAFPRLGVHVRDVRVVGRGAFADVTLASIPDVEVGVDAFSVVRGSRITIRSVSLHQPAFDLRVLEDGTSNADIVKDAGTAARDTAPSRTEISLDRVVIDDLAFAYDDRSSDTAVALSDLDLVLKADLSPRVAALDLDGTIGALTVAQAGTTWLEDTRWTLDGGVDYDLETGGLAFRDNRNSVGDLPFTIDGSATPTSDGWDVDLSVGTKEATFASILALVPDTYRESTEGLDVAGTLSLDASIVGRYAGDQWPELEASLAVADGRIAAPDLPVPIEDLQLAARILHPQGDKDQLRIDVERLALVTAGSPFTASAKISNPFTDPLVDLTARGRLDLAAIGRIAPLPEGTAPPTGTVDLDVAFAGRQSDFTAPNPKRIHASGTAVARDVRWRTPSLPDEAVISQATVRFTSDAATIESLHATSGGSDLDVSGRFDNLVGYALGGDILHGALRVRSDTLDLRPMQGDAAAAAETGTEPAEEGGLLVAVPDDLDVRVDLGVGRLLTKQVELADVAGDVSVADATIRLTRVSAGVLGGRATLSGAYHAPTARTADVNLSIDTTRIRVAQAVETFVTLGRIAPILRGAPGAVDALFTFDTTLAADGTPDLAALASTGRIVPKGVALPSDALAAVARRIGAGSGEIALGDARISYAIDGGDLSLEPVEVRLGGVPATLRGAADLAHRTLDLELGTRLKTKDLAAGAQALGLSEKDLRRAVGGRAEVVVHVTGPYDAPKVALSLDGADAEGLVADVVEDVVRDRAGEAAQALIAAARRRADGILDEAHERGEALVREAEGPIAKAAAREAAKRIEATARDRAEEVIDAAEREARKETSR